MIKKYIYNTYSENAINKIIFIDYLYRSNGMLHDKHPMKLHMKLHFGEFGMPADADIPLFSLFFAFLTKPEVYCAGEFYTMPVNFFTMPVDFFTMLEQKATFQFQQP